MKKSSLVFGIIILLTLTSVYAQKNKKDLILNKALKIEKLIVKNEDITYSLGSVNISESVWIEYDRDGNEIGKANIQEFTDEQIKIKWIFANNGADVGDITVYKYEENDGKMIFNILFDNKEQGFFEATL